jgi:hypothetical protein
MSEPKNPLYITLRVDMLEDDEPQEMADMIIYAIQEFSDPDAPPVTIQSISTSIPEVHGMEF